MTDELLTLDDITAIVKLSRWHVRDVVVKQPGFPRPVCGVRKPRWNASEVRRFFKSAQKANNALQPA